MLQPYQMVKDLRTGVQTSNTGGVLDGDLDQFMEATLAQRASAPGRPRSRTWSSGGRVGWVERSETYHHAEYPAND